MVKLVVTVVALLTLSLASSLAVVTEAKAIVVNGSVTTLSPLISGLKPIAAGPDSAAAESVPVVRGSTVVVGSTIQTGQKSDLLMTPLPGSVVRVLENNSLVLAEADLQKKGETVLGRKAKLQLQRGSVQVGIDKLGSSTDFQITTPQCVAAARGTVFGTNVLKGSTTTIVLEGTVVVPWKDSKGKSHSVDVKSFMKVKIKESPDGLVQEGPEPATQDELDALREFTKAAGAWGLLRLAQVNGFPIPSAAGAPLDSP